MNEVIVVELLKGLEAVTKINLESVIKTHPKETSTPLAIVYSGKNEKGLKSLLADQVPAWQLAKMKAKPVIEFSGKQGPVWVLRPDLNAGEGATLGHSKRFEMGDYAHFRDTIGGFWRQHRANIESIHFHFVGGSEDALVGALAGILLAQYKFIDVLKDADVKVSQLFITKKGGKISDKLFQKAEALATGMNLSRHLTNMPADKATPEKLTQALHQFFAKHKNIKAKIYSEADLKKEKMGLLIGVGQGSSGGSRLLHLKYHAGSKGKKSIALVGKGVTFDTGGLDLKNSSGMRLMKKDMAGAAVMAGLCYFVSKIKVNGNFDFYLPLAENAVSDRSTKPGDVHQSKKGLLVEIDNTDAEGRLVMADAFQLAIEQSGKNKLDALIDVSTLTGAMRVAVGLDVAGFFSTSDSWAAQVEKVAPQMGEMVWRMPLVEKYSRQLNSSFADIKNSSDSGYGGAIIAALFLKKFIDDVPWVHFDAMSWNSSADGALSDGANAQCYQVLAGLLSRGLK